MYKVIIYHQKNSSKNNEVREFLEKEKAIDFFLKNLEKLGFVPDDIIEDSQIFYWQVGAIPPVMVLRKIND